MIFLGFLFSQKFDEPWKKIKIEARIRFNYSHVNPKVEVAQFLPSPKLSNSFRKESFPVAFSDNPPTQIENFISSLGMELDMSSKVLLMFCERLCLEHVHAELLLISFKLTKSY